MELSVQEESNFEVECRPTRPPCWDRERWWAEEEVGVVVGPDDSNHAARREV